MEQRYHPDTLLLLLYYFKPRLDWRHGDPDDEDASWVDSITTGEQLSSSLAVGSGGTAAWRDPHEDSDSVEVSTPSVSSSIRSSSVTEGFERRQNRRALRQKRKQKSLAAKGSFRSKEYWNS